MWIGKPTEIRMLRRLLRSNESDVVVILTQEEAKELQNLIESGRDKSGDDKKTLATANVMARIILGIQTMRSSMTTFLDDPEG